MSIFDRFESAVERGVNGAFSRVFRSGIKAVDITSALKRSMEDHVQELSTDRAIAPNHFLIRMAPSDMDALGDLDILAGEFAQQVTDHAASQGYALLGPISIDAATLLDGNQITIGRTRILFWTHPQSEDAQ